MASASVLIAAAALGIHGLPVSGTGQNQEALLNGVQAEWTDDKGKEYSSENFAVWIERTSNMSKKRIIFIILIGNDAQILGKYYKIHHHTFYE